MANEDKRTTRRAMLASTTFGALTAMLATELPADAAEGDSADEQAAIKVVNDFIGAFPSRDMDQIASFVGDDVVFKGNPNAMELKGKDAFMMDVGRFLNSPMGKSLTFAKRASSAYAVGGPAGTAVLTRRIDVATRNGHRTPTPLAALMWVTDGKIQAWYDFPLLNQRPPGRGAGGNGAGQGTPPGQ